MECGLRILPFLCCLKAIKSAPSDQHQLISDGLYRHAVLISKNLSLYSSLGKHTNAEATGLILAGGVFRHTTQGRQWLKTGVRLLDQELNHQILEDGGPAEQSLNYHRFILDLYWLAIDFLEKNGLQDCAVLKPRLILGEKFLSAFSQKDAGLPLIGDSDDGYAIAPGLSPKRPRPNNIEAGILTFPSSGYTVMRTAGGACLIFDHGPLGMPPLYNHGHADALSIILYQNGEEMLVDPGTYRYNGEPEFRRYFKSTRAHNTVTIDGLDQAVQETGFIWSHPYKAELMNCKEHDGGLFLEATHNGYARLKKPVFHRRKIVLLHGADFLVKDTFSGLGEHEFEINFHLHPNSSVSEEGGWLEIRNYEGVIRMTLLFGDMFRSIRGQESPSFGWYSPRYGVRIESPVLTCIKVGRPETVFFVTVI
jgi:hypothetical protein